MAVLNSKNGDRAIFAFALAALVIIITGGASHAEWVWDSEVGWVDTGVAPAESAREIYAYGKGLAVEGNFASARDVFQRVLTSHPSSEYTARARLAIAQCESELGNFETAARMVSQLLAERPEGIDLNRLAAMQMTLAERIVSTSESSTALAAAAVLAPSASLRMEAQFKLADKQFKAGQFDDSWESYEFAVSESVNPDDKAKAMLMSALSDIAAAGETGNDAWRIERAIRRLKEVVSFMGDTAMLSQAQECLWLAENLLREEDASRREVFHASVLMQSPIIVECSPGYFRKAAKEFKDSAAGEAARFYQAECYFRENKIWKAFKIYEVFAKEYPASRRMRTVIEREFLIGRTLEEEGKRRKLEHVMTAVAHNNPIGPLADDAYMALGRASMETEHYNEARDYFDLVVVEYPRSEWVPAAMYMGGIADLRNSNFANDRQHLLERARSSFELYLRYAPDGPFAPEATSLIDVCREKQSQDMMDIAAFYERRKQPSAAQVYYLEILSEFPGSRAAESAASKMGPAGEEAGS